MAGMAAFAAMQSRSKTVKVSRAESSVPTEPDFRPEGPVDGGRVDLATPY